MKNVYKTLRSDLVIMRKAKNTDRVKFLSYLLGEIDRAGKDYSDEKVREILVKVGKQLSKAPNPNELELTIIGNYLPKVLSEDEVSQLLLINASNLLGKSIGEVVKFVKEHAQANDRLMDGAVIMPLVKQFLGK